jgi:superfamily II DNA helicase RecQ
LKKKIEKINIINDLNGISISMSNNGKINVLNNLEQRNKDRYLWSSQNLKYEINAVEDKKELEYLLQVIFQYTTFREGQLEAIESILNDSNNQIIIMPTGSGKSLIYYFIAFMQPSPVLIIEPTDILIKDQVRNLKELHNIDDCIAYFSVDNTQVNLNHKLIYLTPRVLQNRKFIISLIPHNLE